MTPQDRAARIDGIREWLTKGIILPAKSDLAWVVIQEGVKYIKFLLAELDAAEAKAWKFEQMLKATEMELDNRRGEAERLNEKLAEKLQAAERRIAELEKLGHWDTCPGGKSCACPLGSGTEGR